MSTEIKGYRPLSRESTDRITKAWKWYRKHVRLEIDFIAIIAKMEREGESEDAIRKEVEDRSELIDLFPEYKREIGIGSKNQPAEVEASD